MEKQKMNTTLVYILSVVGLLCCCIWGAGIIPSGIAYFMANKQEKAAMMNPENYENPNAMKTAKIIALVILIINVLMILWMVYQLVTVGFDGLMEQNRLQMEQIGM